MPVCFKTDCYCCPLCHFAQPGDWSYLQFRTVIAKIRKEGLLGLCWRFSDMRRILPKREFKTQVSLLLGSAAGSSPGYFSVCPHTHPHAPGASWPDCSGNALESRPASISTWSRMIEGDSIYYLRGECRPIHRMWACPLAQRHQSNNKIKHHSKGGALWYRITLSLVLYNSSS